MSENDLGLIQVASDLLKKRYTPPVHSVAAALRTKDGTVVASVNIDHFSGFVCAETAALSRAINDGKYDFDSIVAVRMDDSGAPQVANMCGKCRQIFHDYAPNIRVIVADGKQPESHMIEELLAFSFTRQQSKIQAVIQKGSHA